MNSKGSLQCYFCGTANLSKVFTYDAPPEGEVQFQFSASEKYEREIWRCDACGHFLSVHDMDMDALYAGDYVNSTYGDDGIRRAFERITSLDPSRSDNVGRVNSILDFTSKHRVAQDNPHPTVLDVGSGLCVFLHRMKAAGWECTALDPDERAAKHARERVGVQAVCGNFMEARDIGRFDLISFNKVLEHVQDPVLMLAKALEHLGDSGLVYVEVPDGEAAAADGPGREEFFIDHHHVFSFASLALLARRAGFSALMTERLREPSTKYTLRTFLIAA